MDQDNVAVNEAAAFIVDFLRKPGRDGGYPSDGYDDWFPTGVTMSTLPN
jgi:hypothetical protein